MGSLGGCYKFLTPLKQQAHLYMYVRNVREVNDPPAVGASSGFAKSDGFGEAAYASMLPTIYVEEKRSQGVSLQGKAS